MLQVTDSRRGGSVAAPSYTKRRRHSISGLAGSRQGRVQGGVQGRRDRAADRSSIHGTVADSGTAAAYITTEVIKNIHRKVIIRDDQREGTRDSHGNEIRGSHTQGIRDNYMDGIRDSHREYIRDGGTTAET